MELLAQATVEEQIAFDSVVVTETYYFWTVAFMWLLHVGFMTYEAGVSRRKNVMSTAMKNIMTIAVVTPAFYYAGWWVYACFPEGFKYIGTDDGFCASTIPWDANMGPNLGDNITGVFWAAFLLFSWTTGSIMSGSVLERIRISAYLLLTVALGAFVWIVAAAWGWHGGGWLVTHFGYHDLAASGVVHGIAGFFALGVLLNLGPRIGKYGRDGSPRAFKPHNLHLTLMGLMIIFTAFYAFYAACLVIQTTVVPGWLNIYLSPATLSAITFTITVGFAGGFTGGFLVSKADPFWTISGGLAGVVGVSAGADIYHPSLTYLLAMFSGALAFWAGTWLERKARVDDAVGAVSVHGVLGLVALLYVGIFAAGFPTGLGGPDGLGVDTTLLGQVVGLMTLFPLAFVPGYVISWLLKQANLLRVPPEVELEGLDMAEFQQDFYPEFGRAEEVIVLDDGSEEIYQRSEAIAEATADIIR